MSLRQKCHSLTSDQHHVTLHMTIDFDAWRQRMHARFDLAPDQAEHADIDQTLRAGVEFRGTNLWVLILAIFIASIGLNVNSTAVIIGAMLISPLMGPIMALGYGAGINDSQLIRASLFNLLLAVALSLMASTLYFLLTPLSQAHSELLARTAPSIWDVLIAFIGGLAGVIGMTRRHKSNLIPGVAIATALMPPLCTAGYGLAMRNAHYFFGAFYLFTINCVFIAIATLVMVRWMGLPSVRDVSERSASRKRHIIGSVIVLTLLPSLYLAFQLVEKELFERSGSQFVSARFRGQPQSMVLAQDFDYRTKKIAVTLVGKTLSPAELESIKQSLPEFGLHGVNLVVTQSTWQTGELSALKTDLMQEIMRLNAQKQEQPSTSASGSTEPVASQSLSEPQPSTLTAILREMSAQFPEADSIKIVDGIEVTKVGSPPNLDSGAQPVRVFTVSLTLSRPLPDAEILRIRRGLQVRLGLQTLDSVRVQISSSKSRK